MVSYQTLLLREGGTDKEYFLKIIQSQNLKTARDFLNEIEFSLIVQGSRLEEFVPKIIQSSTITWPYWYLREHVVGEKSGQIELFNRGFESNFLKPRLMSKLIDFFDAMWEAGSREDFRRKFPLKRETYLVHYLDLALQRHQKFLGSRIVKQSLRVLHNEYSSLLMSFYIFNHSDLNVDNIIFVGDGLKVVDWELAAYSFPLQDQAFTYVQAWRSPAWQDEFKTQALDHFARNAEKQTQTQMREVVNNYWRLMVLFHCAQQIDWGRLVYENHRNALQDGAEIGVYLKALGGIIEHEVIDQ